ncbi:hypothetical protein Bsp3421_004828 [Burkholderia sp. FERM BP-3421]|nr:hypothetical protein [Burkholderia sp. FERM BP-3421]WDD94693.1 hypothetical protein Bsp3421_004828 [Burkholderia sp. FERM BP-3421]
MRLPQSLVRLVTCGFGVLLSGAFLSARAEPSRPPLVLDTQAGIHDGKSGIVLQNAPLSRAPIATPAQMTAPAELAPNSVMPVIVAPYVQVPAWNGAQPQPQLPPRQPRQ